MKKLLLILLLLPIFVNAQIYTIKQRQVSGLRQSLDSAVKNMGVFGMIYNKNSWSSTTDSIVNNGATFSIVSNKISASGGASNYTQTIDFDKNLISTNGQTNCEYWRIFERVKVVTIGNGFGTGIRSNNINGEYNILAFVNPSGPTTYIVSAGTVLKTAASTPAISANDYIDVSLERAGKNLQMIVQNHTTNSAPVVTNYTYNTPTDVLQNNGRFSFFSINGSFVLDSVAIFMQEPVGADIGVLADSKARYNAGYDSSFVELLKNDYNVVVSSGGYETTADWEKRLGEMIALRCKIWIMNNPSNDARTGVNTDSTKARYDRIEQALRAAGCQVYHTDAFYEQGVTPTAWFTYIHASRSADSIINTFYATQVNGALDADLVHLTAFGHRIVYNQIIQARKFLYIKSKPTGTVVASNAILDQTSITQTAAYKIDGASSVLNTMTIGKTALENTAPTIRAIMGTNNRALVRGLSGMGYLSFLQDDETTGATGNITGSAINVVTTGGTTAFASDGSVTVPAKLSVGNTGMSGTVAMKITGGSNQTLQYFYNGADNNLWFADNGLSAGKTAVMRASTWKIGMYTTGGANVDAIDIDASGNSNISNAIRANSYGLGIHTGTATKTLQVDASGNIIEGTNAVTSNIYTADGTILANRTATLTNDKNLLFTGTGTNTFIASIVNSVTADTSNTVSVNNADVRITSLRSSATILSRIVVNPDSIQLNTSTGEIHFSKLNSSSTPTTDSSLTYNTSNHKVAMKTFTGVVSSSRLTGQTGAASLTTYNVPAADASYLVSANILVTTATLHNFTCTVTYTDEGNTSRTVTLNFSTLAGALTPTIANAGGAVPYEGVPLHIRCKASTTIIVATTGTFTTVTYNLENEITKLN